MKASEWIDRVKVAKGYDSDYRAAKELGITRGGMSHIRTGESASLSEETTVRVAESLGIDPAIVLADQARERSKSDAARTAWGSILERLGGVAAGVLAVVGVNPALLNDVAALCALCKPEPPPAKPARRRPVMVAMARTLAGAR